MLCIPRAHDITTIYGHSYMYMYHGNAQSTKIKKRFTRTRPTKLLSDPALKYQQQNLIPRAMVLGHPYAVCITSIATHNLTFALYLI